MTLHTKSIARVLTEDRLSMQELRNELFELTGHDYSFAAVCRWGTYGVRGVKLEVVHVGRRVFTSKQAVTRFLNATQA